MSISMPEAPTLDNLEFQTSLAFSIFEENSELDVFQLVLPEVDTSKTFDFNEEAEEDFSKTTFSSEGYIVMKNAKTAYSKGAVLNKKESSALKFCNYKIT